MVAIDKSKCIGCGQCVADCVSKVLHLTDGKARTSRQCLQCGHCVAICPAEAVSIPEYDMEDVMEYKDSSFTLSPEIFLNAVKFRRSIRKFKDLPVEQEKLFQLIEAGRYTATAVNSQKVSYVMVQDRLEEFKPLAWQGWIDYANMLPDGQAAFASSIRKFYGTYQNDKRQDRLFFNAPVLLIIASDNLWDAGLAAQNIEMMAVAQGLGVLYNGFVLRAIKQNPKAVEWLGLTGKTPACCMLIGYPAVAYLRTAPRKPADITWK